MKLKKIFQISQFKLNFISGILTNGLNIGVYLLTYPVYLHFLGFERYGVWLVLSIFLSLAQVGQLGIDQAVMKLVAEEHGKRSIIGIQKCFSTALITIIFIGLILLIVVSFWKVNLIKPFNLSKLHSLLVLDLLPSVVFLSVLVVIVQSLLATLSGLGRLDLSNYIVTLGRLSLILVSCIMLFFGYDIRSLLIGNIVSYSFMGFLALLAIWFVAHFKIFSFRYISFKYFKKIINFGSGMFGILVLNLLLTPFNKFIVTKYIGVSFVPIFEIASNGSMQIRNLLEAGFRSFIPEISMLSGKADFESHMRINTLSRKALQLLFKYGGFFYILVVLGLNPFLKFWLGSNFQSILPDIFRPMLLGSFISLLGVPAFYTMLGLGKVNYCLTMSFVQTIVNILLILFGLAYFDSINIMWIATSICIAKCLSNVYLIIKQRISINQLLRDGREEVINEGPSY